MLLSKKACPKANYMTENILDSYAINRKMPENYIEVELDFCKDEFSYRTYDVQLIDLKNCIVNKRGFIYEEAKFRLSKINLIDEQLYQKFLSIKHYIKRVLIKKKRTLKEENYLLVYDDWTNAHYHWFCDLLPRLFVIKDRLKDYTLLLPDTAYVRDQGLKSLAFFELQPAAIEFIQEDELVKVKKLSVLTHTCLSGYINDKIMQDMRAFISTKVDYSHSPDRKLYITRDKARYRKVLNEPEVLAVVKDFGYEVIRYEDYSFEEQVALTASAKSIVAMHGAGLVNMLYLHPEGSVLEFRRNKIYHNQCFWHLAKALRLKYFYLFGTPDDDHLVIEGEGCNLTIDIARLKSTLSMME